MKKVDYLLITSTNTPEGQEETKANIIESHTAPVAMGGKGWNRPGIDYLIDVDGKLHTLIPEQSTSEVDLWGIAEGKDGLLGIPKVIAFAGGKDEDGEENKNTCTEAQKKALEAIVKFYLLKFPQAQVMGFSNVPALKGNPNPMFNVGDWCKEIGIPESNCFYSSPSDSDEE